MKKTYQKPDMQVLPIMHVQLLDASPSEIKNNNNVVPVVGDEGKWNDPINTGNEDETVDL